MTGNHTCIKHTQSCLAFYQSSYERHTCYSPASPTHRDDFSVKLALLSNQWQCVVRRAQQRRGIIDSLARQWQNYQEMADKLLRWLQEVTRDPDVHQSGEAVALLQARNLLDQIQVGFYFYSHQVIILIKSSILVFPVSKYSLCWTSLK